MKSCLDRVNNHKTPADWLKKDARAQKLIVTSLEKQPLTHILTCTSSKEMFKKICSVYERDTEQQKCMLLQEFFNYKYQRGKDMATHVSTLQNIAYKLKVLNTDINDIMIISKILATLPDTYKHFCECVGISFHRSEDTNKSYCQTYCRRK